MPVKRVVTIGPLIQRTAQGIVLKKNAAFTQPSTEGNTITAYLLDEGSHEGMSGAINVTVGTPTGSAENENVAFEIDTLTGIALTGRIQRFAFYVVDSAGNQLVPNKATGDKVILILQKNPSA